MKTGATSASSEKAGKLPDVDFASLRSSFQDEATTLAEIIREERRPAREIGNPRLERNKL